MRYCSSCKEHKAARKIVKFCGKYLPKVLVLSLKRFEFRDVSGLTGFNGAAHREKIDAFIDFPIDGLDLAPFCQSKVHTSTKYDLFAVCNHYGRMGFGHYTAAARDWDGDKLCTQWFSYHDNDVSSSLSAKEMFY